MKAGARTLALILARGGSKGIPRKNVKLLAAKPLIAWTIEAALASELIKAVVTSTDDDEIAAVSREYGASVPFMRPAALASDESPAIDAVMHALNLLPEFDSVIVLQPTSPLRTTQDIDSALILARDRKAPSVVSVTEPDHHPSWMYRFDSHQCLTPLMSEPAISRRQDLPPVYVLNGALYYARVDWLRRHQRFVGPDTVGFVMPPERSIDLDTPLGWTLVELMLKESL